MKFYPYLLALVLLGLVSVESAAQYRLSPAELDAIPALRLPLQDNDALMTKELASRKPGRPISFAVALPTAIRTSTHGKWSVEGSYSVWRLKVRSVGAKTLNLGFSEFHLPAGANFYLLSPQEQYGPFTKADNEEHNQFWTPIIEGEELLLELRVPTPLKKRAQIFLTSVNHDFQGITKSLSGACNLDVLCGEEDGWGIVDGYRDIIRSVAAYTLGGTDACTGFLVNNVNQDGQPFFMTADHCNISQSNAPTLVAYWNFESDVCRQPGSSESGQIGFGSRNIFNSGTRLLANWANSDFTLTLLDDPVNPAANAYFAGWDANPALPSDTTVAIHHPGVDEKRISFSFNQTYRVNVGGGTPEANGNLLEVPDWSIGTTEGGSSGSPIFDVDGYVRGQLFGGRAACGNDLYDVYGYFPVSWEGNNSPDTRLKDWLDPCATGTLTLEGMDYADLAFTLTANGNCRTFCAGVPVRIEVAAGVGYPANSDVRIVSASPGIGASLSVDRIAGGESFDLIVESDAGLADGTYTVVVRAASTAGTDDIELFFNVEEGLAAAPQELAPADNETDVNPIVTLSWEMVDQAISYDLQVSANEDFSFVSYSGVDLAENELALPATLEANTTYFWRVRTNNNCGAGAWAVYSFTTENLSCSAEFSTDTPVEIPSSGTPTVSSSLVSSFANPIQAMEVTVVIDHSFIGDLEGELTSPNGTTIQLFNPVLNGNCGGANMVVTFNDAAVQTHADFEDACDATSDVAVAGIFQPAEALAAFNGEIPAGTWNLSIRDEANFDGGQIVGLRIDFCGSGATSDFRAQSAITVLSACNDSPASFDLLLGEDFTPGVTLSASVEGIPLTDVSTSFDEASDLLSVVINSWGGVTLGTSALTLEVANPGGPARMVTIPVTLSRASTAAELSTPIDNASVPEVDIEFAWRPVAGASGYRLEYALDSDFTELLGSVELAGSSRVVQDLPGGKIFWRVIALTPCGEVVSTVNAFTITTNSTQDFGQGRELAVFPNPVQGVLTVETKGNWPGIIRADLFDASGRFVAKYRINGAGRTEWNLGGIAAGVYYLRFSGAGQQRTERLVVLP